MTTTNPIENVEHATPYALKEELKRRHQVDLEVLSKSSLKRCKTCKTVWPCDAAMLTRIAWAAYTQPHPT